MNELDDFADSLFQAVPAMKHALRSRGDEAEPDHEIPVLWLGTVGRALVAVLPQLDEAQAATAFEIVERYVEGGSSSMKDALCTGLLEAVADEVSAGRLDGPTLAALLGPESRAYVDAWDQFSLGRSSLE
ncbi:MAG: DUF7674 family protein [Nocardioides sp.]